MGAPSFNLAAILPMLQKLMAGPTSAAGPSALPASATPLDPGTGYQTGGPGSANLQEGNIDPTSGANGPMSPVVNPTALGTDPQAAQLAQLAKYANVMKGLEQSKDQPPEVGHSPTVNLRSSLDPQLTPIKPVSRTQPGPQSVGAALASPEGRRLIEALAQINAGMEA